MPVVGYIIVFNSTLSGHLSTILPADLTRETDDVWIFLYSRNLYFLYFGLLLFGSGVALFNITAPPQVRRFPAVENYIAAMDAMKSRNLVIGSFNNVVNIFFSSLEGEERSPFFDARKFSYPSDLSTSLHGFVEQTWQAFVKKYPSQTGAFTTGSGYLKSDEILELAYFGGRAHRILQKQLLDQAVSHPTDVFYLEHRTLEYRRGLARVLVFLLYTIGSILLVIPSIFTSIVILKYW